MSFWDWANEHWFVFGFVVIVITMGSFEVLAGLGKGLSRINKSKRDDVK